MRGEELQESANHSSIEFHQPDANGNVTQVDIIGPDGVRTTLRALSFERTDSDDYVKITPYTGNEYTISTHDLARVGLRRAAGYIATMNETNVVRVIRQDGGFVINNIYPNHPRYMPDFIYPMS